VIVVTGASGFIGSAVVGQLAASGVAVTGLDRRPPAEPTGSLARGLARLTNDRSAPRHVQADLADPLAPAVRDLLAAADAVVHLAGRPGVRDRAPGIELARHRDNVLATRAVLDAARGPVLAASSSSVYGGSRGGRACDEGDALRPTGGYATSKATAEDACAAARAGGAAVCVLRPFTVVGPGQRPDMALDHWIRAALARRPVEVYGGLHRSRDVTDVRAVVAAITQLVDMATSGATLPDVLNLGTGRARTLGELLDAVRRTVGGPLDVRVTPPPVDDPDHTRADTSRCAATLGWVPATDLDDVVAAQLGRHQHGAARTQVVARSARTPSSRYAQPCCANRELDVPAARVPQRVPAALGDAAAPT
jgi:nucleoside-diphosphate-sugar epimerase